MTYGELWKQTCAYAGALRARGIGRGSRVAMIVPNVPDFPRVYFAVLSLGAVVVPVHLLFKAREIEYVLQDSEADLVIAAAPMLAEAGPAAEAADLPLLMVLQPPSDDPDVKYPRLEAEAEVADPLVRHLPVHPTDAATILYTSGTTGQPKGRGLSRLRSRAGALFAHRCLQPRPGRRRVRRASAVSCLWADGGDEHVLPLRSLNHSASRI